MSCGRHTPCAVGLMGESHSTIHNGTRSVPATFNATRSVPATLKNAPPNIDEYARESGGQKDQRTRLGHSAQGVVAEIGYGETRVTAVAGQVGCVELAPGGTTVLPDGDVVSGNARTHVKRKIGGLAGRIAAGDGRLPIAQERLVIRTENCFQVGQRLAAYGRGGKSERRIVGSWGETCTRP